MDAILSSWVEILLCLQGEESREKVRANFHLGDSQEKDLLPLCPLRRKYCRIVGAQNVPFLRRQEENIGKCNPGGPP